MTKVRSTPARLPAALLLAGFLIAGLTAGARADSPIFFSAGGAAISGYDPVAYFTVGRPVSGRAEFAVVWKGVEWHFATRENRAAFEANPRAYAPQYGGYCAYGLAAGTLSSTEPDAWVIHEGKLYLVHSVRLREIWRQDADGYVARADRNWPDVLKR